MNDPICVERARARVTTGHGLVLAGKYAAALAIFVDALEELRRQLGPRHPEVEELEADLTAVRQMADVQAFGEEAGIRHWTQPEDKG